MLIVSLNLIKSNVYNNKGNKIINKGKILVSDTKQNLLNLIGKKTVSFILNEKIQIPRDLQKYNPVINDNKLLINYDKKMLSNTFPQYV